MSLLGRADECAALDGLIDGVRRGIRWKTEIPVTDPMAPKR